jgi:RNA polymerase sigma-70 factor (ECF subfamily)
LLVRVRARETTAWERLVHLYTPLVCRWCQAERLQPADVQDVGQEVFQAVWRSIDTFRRERPTDTFRGWLRTITRNKIVDFYRRRQAAETPVGGSDALTLAQEVVDSAPIDTDAEVDNAEASLLYRRAVGLIRTEFQEKTWRAFQALALEDRSPREVAAELGMSVGAVYSAKSRVLKRLHDEFADLLDL